MMCFCNVLRWFRFCMHLFSTILSSVLMHAIHISWISVVYTLYKHKKWKKQTINEFEHTYVYLLRVQATYSRILHIHMHMYYIKCISFQFEWTWWCEYLSIFNRRTYTYFFIDEYTLDEMFCEHCKVRPRFVCSVSPRGLKKDESFVHWRYEKFFIYISCRFRQQTSGTSSRIVCTGTAGIQKKYL